MPYLKVQTNKDVKKDDLPEKFSAKLAESLGKSESYVMVAFEDNVNMSFGGNKKPTAFMELKSIGLKANMTEDLSKMLCTLAHQELGVAKNRVYIEFKDAPGKMWGWNSGTF